MKPFAQIAYENQAPFGEHDISDTLLNDLVPCNSNIEESEQLVSISWPMDGNLAIAMLPSRSSVPAQFGPVCVLPKDARFEETGLREEHGIEDNAAI